jgi:hypothetical protein
LGPARPCLGWACRGAVQTFAPARCASARSACRCRVHPRCLCAWGGRLQGAQHPARRRRWSIAVNCTRRLVLNNGSEALRPRTPRVLLQQIGAAFETDPTLGGLAFGLTYGRPQPSIEAVAGGPAIKARRSPSPSSMRRQRRWPEAPRRVLCTCIEAAADLVSIGRGTGV